jgi:hypothetical protein
LLGAFLIGRTLLSFAYYFHHCRFSRACFSVRTWLADNDEVEAQHCRRHSRRAVSRRR